MNRNELIDAVAAAADMAPSEVRACLEAFLGTRQATGVLTALLLDCGKVQLAGFGTFEVRQRPARNGHNPRTGERIAIAASVTAAFRPATSLRQHLQAAHDSRQPDRPRASLRAVGRGNS